MNEQILNFKYNKEGEREVFPAHHFVSNWLFKADEEEEATLAHSLAILAEKNGMSNNDMHHIFPVVLRIMKSKIDWSK